MDTVGMRLELLERHKLELRISRAHSVDSLLDDIVEDVVFV
jgi:hypothetical protein